MKLPLNSKPKITNMVQWTALKNIYFKSAVVCQTSASAKENKLWTSCVEGRDICVLQIGHFAKANNWNWKVFSIITKEVSCIKRSKKLCCAIKFRKKKWFMHLKDMCTFSRSLQLLDSVRAYVCVQVCSWVFAKNGTTSHNAKDKDGELWSSSMPSST